MLRVLVAGMLLVATALPALAADHLVPKWMKVDAAGKKVEMDVIAGYNPNNNNWNYDGYYEGDLTVVVPEGWRVKISFKNRDANYPHSLVVVDDPGDVEKHLEKAGREDVAIKRAYSKSPTEGIFGKDKDTISFKARPAGDYLFYCGVPAHGLSGMWVKFKISAETETPYVEIAEDAEAGRP